MREVVVTYDDVPPSYNTFQRSHWSKQARLKSTWQGTFEGLLVAAGLPRDRFASCEASAMLRFPTRTRRDEGNFKVMIEKALGDALVNGRWLPDDTHRHFRFTHAGFEEERGPRRTVLTLRFAEELAA